MDMLLTLKLNEYSIYLTLFRHEETLEPGANPIKLFTAVIYEFL